MFGIPQNCADADPRHPRGAFVLAGRGRRIVRGGEIPPEPLHGQRGGRRLRSAGRAVFQPPQRRRGVAAAGSTRGRSSAPSSATNPRARRYGSTANGSTTTCCSVSRSVWASTTAAVSSNCPTPWPTTACSTSRSCAPFTSGTSSSAFTNSSTARSTRSATSCGSGAGYDPHRVLARNRGRARRRTAGAYAARIHDAAARHPRRGVAGVPRIHGVADVS